MKTRYALTNRNACNVRQLTRANQGQNHFDTFEEGEAYLANFLANNTEATLAEVFGPRSLGTFAIFPVNCFDHGDAERIYLSHALDTISDLTDSAL